jgi:hypothetical protein
VYAGKLASDASTQYILIKSDTTPKPTLSKIPSTPSPSFSRQSTSDFCADNMMNRDPVARLSQRRSATIEHEPSSVNEQEIQINTQPEQEIQINTQPEQEIDFTIENNEERMALELAIKRSLEDQQESIIEINNEISITVESPSDSDG